jgi:hypothetical protein
VPTGQLRVIGKPVCWKVRYPVDPSAHSLQPATLCESYQYKILIPLGICVFGREQAIMLFGKCIQLVHSLAICTERRGYEASAARLT